MDERGLKTLLARRRAGQVLRVHAFRRDELIERQLTLAEAPAAEAQLRIAPKAAAAAQRLRTGWLGRSVPAGKPGG